MLIQAKALEALQQIEGMSVRVWRSVAASRAFDSCFTRSWSLWTSKSCVRAVQLWSVLQPNRSRSLFRSCFAVSRMERSAPASRYERTRRRPGSFLSAVQGLALRRHAILCTPSTALTQGPSGCLLARRGGGLWNHESRWRRHNLKRHGLDQFAVDLHLPPIGAVLQLQAEHWHDERSI